STHPLNSKEEDSYRTIHLSEEASKINARNQDEDQAGPNPGVQDEDQARPNPGIAAESQLQSNQVILEEPASSIGTLSSLQNLDKDLSFTDQFFMEKPHEEELGKTNPRVEVQLMVSLPIHQDTSSVPPMTTPFIDLTKSNLSEAHSQAVDEIVTDAVDWAMQAPFQARFRDLPTVDMKEILQQRMFEDNSYYAHDVHNDLYEALQKSLELDYTNQRLADQEEARKNRQKRRDLPPPPPPLSTGTSRSAQQQGNKAPSSSKSVASASQSMAWTTSDTRYESASVFGTHKLSPTDYLMQNDSIPEEKVLLSDDEDSENDHQPKADAYEVVKAFYPDVIHIQFQMEEYHKMLTDQVDWANPEGDQVRINVNRPLPLCDIS
ncbi:hypothetical protein Tco_1423579, partial [Tanacetum coccineum]